MPWGAGVPDVAGSGDPVPGDDSGGSKDGGNVDMDEEEDGDEKYN